MAFDLDASSSSTVNVEASSSLEALQVFSMQMMPEPNALFSSAADDHLCSFLVIF